MGTVTVNASAHDTVETLKNKIEEREGIPAHLQKLRCCTRTLPDHMLLEDCMVHNNSTISLSMGLKGGVQIHVKAIGKGPSFSLEMELSDTVEKLKEKIQEQHGIPQQDLKLAFRGKNLSNEALLDTINQLKSKGKATFIMTQKKSASDPAEKDKKESKEDQVPATLCINNCGFYGTQANGGYCSSCFKELGLVSTNSSKSEETKSETEETKIEPEEIDPSKIQTDTAHCWKCNRKVGLLGFTCKCKYVFCGEHRYSDKHECSFDYKTKGIEDLTKKLERVQDKKGLHS